MSELLSDKELDKTLKEILGTDDWKYTDKPHRLTELIRSQKKAHGRMVIGHYENHNEQCATYRKNPQSRYVCICNARQRNTLREEQARRNKI